ncbi:MAG: helix-turn-helix domain-containing protein [Henriciella sp.]|nr:helix-turn-helix domain-containing protein [Henriciella sp.]
MNTQSMNSVEPAVNMPRGPQTAPQTIATRSRQNILRFAPHEHIFMEGDLPKGIYQIVAGTVTLYRVMADGRRQIQAFVSEGEYLTITFGRNHDISAEALTDVVVTCEPRAVFDRRLQDDADFRRSVFTLIADKLQDAREQALLLGRKNAMERTASFLLFLDERFSDPQTGYANIRMSRCDIADYLGLTLETVSRMLNKLKQMGVIDLPHATRFAVRQRQRLIALAGELQNQDYIAA